MLVMTIKFNKYFGAVLCVLSLDVFDALFPHYVRASIKPAGNDTNAHYFIFC